MTPRAASAARWGAFTRRWPWIGRKAGANWSTMTMRILGCLSAIPGSSSASMGNAGLAPRARSCLFRGPDASPFLIEDRREIGVEAARREQALQHVGVSRVVAARQTGGAGVARGDCRAQEKIHEGVGLRGMGGVLGDRQRVERQR